MQLYQPTEPETAAAVALLTTRLPADADRIARGALLLPALTYETCAERNGYWQDAGLPFRVNADPGWMIPSAPDERRNAADAEDSTPRSYNVTRSGCTCWAYLAAASAMTGTLHCRHTLAVQLYREIVAAKLNALAGARAIDLRPAGRYPHCYDVVSVWGRTVAGVQYAPVADRWAFEDDAGLARFAAWLTTDEAMSEIQRPRAREEIDL